MAKQYKLTLARRATNKLMAFLAWHGRGSAWQLTTTGRNSGERRRVMIAPVGVGETEYLVAPYGTVGWVLNLRASNRAVLARGDITRRITAIEVSGEEAGRALAKHYHDNYKHVEQFFDFDVEPTVIDFARVVVDHPVFRVEGPFLG